MIMMILLLIILVLILAWISFSGEYKSLNNPFIYLTGKKENKDPDSDADLQEQYSYLIHGKKKEKS